MEIIDALIAKVEAELMYKLASVSDPTIRQLVSDLNSLKRTREMMQNGGPVQARLPLNQNGNSTSRAMPQMTQGDAAAEIIKHAGRPLHVDAILAALPAYGVKAEKQTLVSVILKDRRGRFVRTAPNTFDVRRVAVQSDTANKVAANGQSKQRSALPPGFSLIESIKALLPELKGEFSQPIIYDLLCEKYPGAAPAIQKASIAAMLTKLAERGLIEVTDVGYGSSPRKYRRKGVN